MGRVWAQSSRKDGELLVLLALADFANDQGESWPSVPVLAHKARLSERQARKVLDKLEQAGEIRRVRSNGGRNRRNHYVVLLPENPEIKTLIKEQGLINPVSYDRKTLSPVTGALNRHRTVNKNTEPDGSNSLSTNGKKGKSSSPDPIQAEALAEFYEAYPKHVGRAEAEKAWMKLNPNPELRAKIMIGTRRYAEEMRDVEPRFIKHPGPWLNARRWEDESASGSPKHQQSQMRNIG